MLRTSLMDRTRSTILVPSYTRRIVRNHYLRKGLPLWRLFTHQNVIVWQWGDSWRTSAYSSLQHIRNVQEEDCTHVQISHLTVTVTDRVYFLFLGSWIHHLSAEHALYQWASSDNISFSRSQLQTLDILSFLQTTRLDPINLVQEKAIRPVTKRMRKVDTLSKKNRQCQHLRAASNSCSSTQL